MEKVVSIDERVLDEAMRLSGIESVDNVIQMVMTMYINIRLISQGLIRKCKGALRWDTGTNPTESARERIRAGS